MVIELCGRCLWCRPGFGATFALRDLFALPLLAFIFLFWSQPTAWCSDEKNETAGRPDSCLCLKPTAHDMETVSIVEEDKEALV